MARSTRIPLSTTKSPAAEPDDLRAELDKLAMRVVNRCRGKPLNSENDTLIEPSLEVQIDGLKVCGAYWSVTRKLGAATAVEENAYDNYRSAIGIDEALTNSRAN